MAPRLVQRPTIPRGLQTELLGDNSSVMESTHLSSFAHYTAGLYGLDGRSSGFCLYWFSYVFLAVCWDRLGC